MRVKTCRTCQDNGPDVAYRPSCLSSLCVGCYLDAVAGSTTRAVVAILREHLDRYAVLAARHGI